MNDSFLIDRIKEVFSIKDAIERYTDINLNRSRLGRGYSVRCPFHEDRSPSFTIWLDTNRWKCQAGCGHGDQIDLVAKTLQIQLRDAIKLLASNLGLDEPLDSKREKELKKKAKIKKSEQQSIETFKAQFDEVFYKALAVERMVEDKLSNIKSFADLENIGDLYHVRDYLGYLLDCMVHEDLKGQIEAFKEVRRCLNKWQIA